jgi:hypothetical protein
MPDLLQDLGERVKDLAGDWTKYSVIGSFLLYVLGYLALRFHLTALGIGTDLAVLDERYLFTGARFLVYLVASVPSIVLIGLVAWAIARTVPIEARITMSSWITRPHRLAAFGIVFAVIAIQFVMRQCFFVNNLLLAPDDPSRPAWLTYLIVHDEVMPLYFSALVVMAALPCAILVALRAADPREVSPFATGLLAFLAVVQIVLLPVNYGYLIVDKRLPRVAALGDEPIDPGAMGWLVWEGKDGVTFLVRDPELGRRSLVTLPRDQAKRIEIVGFDPILPTVVGAGEGGER